MPPELLSPQQAAAVAGVSKVALWKARNRGEIRAEAITSRGALYTRQAVEGWKLRRKARQHHRGQSYLNADDTVAGVVTIEATTQKFLIWERGVRERGFPEKWDTTKLAKVLNLLNPVGNMIADLVEELEKRGAKELKRRELARLSVVSD